MSRVRACAIAAACTLVPLVTVALIVHVETNALSPSPPEVDLSGYGTCDGRNIQVESAFAWTQYPAPLRVERVDPYATTSFLEGFVGRNAIVWARDHDVQGFVVDATDANNVTTSTQLHVQGPCHFTLDAIPEEEPK